MNKNKIANTVLAGVLALAVIGIGYSAYRQKIQADTIVPGYATLHLGLKVTIPTAQEIMIKAVAYPESGGKRYYFKERTFTFDSVGINNVEWYIRKIPADNYKVVVTSSGGAFTPESQVVVLQNDTTSKRSVYKLFLGEPLEISSPVATPSATISPSESDTTVSPSPTPSVAPSSTSSPSNDGLMVPPVPTLPTI